ncbi:MAG TPA: DUF1775 domain-containing protein [Rhizomicrobium sp.]|nr:DUF1775 domain-containing protein [Rhizomicrobium sp.]
MRSKIALALFVASIAPAAAHVSLAVPSAKAGSHFVATFRIGHGCAGAATTALRIELPDTIPTARPQPKPGWTLNIARAKLAKPVQGEMGESLNERVRAIEWTNGSLPADEFDEFAMMFKVPAESASFTAVQTCGKVVERWAGQDASHPAPKLAVTASDGHDDMAGMTMNAAPASSAVASVTVSEAWLRALPQGLPAGGYFKLHNHGTKPLTLNGASSPACSMLMLHKSESDNGMSRMSDVATVDIAPGADIAFAPGGYHLMCMDARLQPGTSVPVALRFADGSHADATFAVRNAAGK